MSDSATLGQHRASIVAILGKRDFPTDALEDYCRLLGGALVERDCEFVMVRVSWDEMGWQRAIGNLWRQSAAWKGDWAMVQYTALSWSRHGFPPLLLVVLCALKLRGVRIAVVFHDQDPSEAKRPVDRIRRVCQRAVMRAAYRLSDATVLTVPPEQVAWLPRRKSKATFIPVGANFPANHATPSAPTSDRAKTIAVFAITDAGDTSREIADIAMAARRAAEQIPGLRLVTLGRGSRESECGLRQALAGSGVAFTALGILPPNRVSQVLASADVALFVRGCISTHRGSAIASIANAVPLVAYAGSCPPQPIAEAGVVTVPHQDCEELAKATVRVLTDPALWRNLHERSRNAYQKYFAWPAVARRYLETLPHG